MSKRDYYEVLGVGRSANDAELKKSFRRLSVTYDPERCPDDATAPDKFNEAKEHRDVSSDQPSPS